MSGLSDSAKYRTAQVGLNFLSVVADASRSPRMQVASQVFGAGATLAGRMADLAAARPSIGQGNSTFGPSAPIDQRPSLNAFNDFGGGQSRSMSQSFGQGGFRR